MKNSLLYRKIALECETPEVPAMEVFAKYGPELLERFNLSLAGAVERLKETVIMPSFTTNSKSIATIRKHGLTTLSNLQYPTPIGFKGDYLGYLGYLNESFDSTERHLAVLDTTIRELSAVVTSPDKPVAMLVEQMQYFIQLQEQLEVTGRQAGEYINPDSSVAELPLDKLIKRGGDWDAVISESDALAKRVAKQDRKSVVHKVAEIDRLTSRLVLLAKADKFKGASKDWIRTISEGIFAIARLIEFYSITIYRSLVLVTAVTDDCVKLAKVSIRD